MEKDKISFKPLHEGMGFHPFSDGLPYAPESKAKASPTTSPAAPKSTSMGSAMGTGAMSAGRPQFATARQLKQIQEQHQVTPALVIPTLGRPATVTPSPKIVTTQISLGARPAKLEPKPTAAPQPAPAEANSLIRRRVFAYLMDTVIHTGFWMATNLAALFFFNFQIDAEILQAHIVPFFAFFMVSQWFFIALQEVLFETTIGKAFFNLEFKRNHRSLFLRSIVFMFAGAFGLQDKLGQLQLKQKIYS